MEQKWIQAWGMSHAGMSLLGYRGNGRTFRLTVHSAIAGEQIRLSLSNRFSKNRVKLGSAYAAVCDERGWRIGESIPILFSGKAGVELAAGESARSDAAALPVAAGGYLSVSIYVEKGKLLSGNALDDAWLAVCRGDHATDVVIQHQRRIKDSVLHVAEKVLGMYLSQPVPLFEAVEVLNGEGASAIVCFGDSITQQGRWFNPFAGRIREQFPGRYAVVNRSITGNRLLRDCWSRFPLKKFFGSKALERFQWDVGAFDGIKYMVVCLGTNDYAQPGTIGAPKADRITAQEVIGGLRELVQMAHARDITVYGATLIPFGGSADCTPEKDQIRVEINRRLMQENLFDGIVDFDAVFAREGNPYLAKEGYTSKDGGHPSPLGGQALAQCVPLEWFTEQEASVIE